MIEGFYNDFHKKVNNVIGNVGKASGEKKLGLDPSTGENVIVRIGPFGPMVQIGEKNEEDSKKPRYASLLKGQTMQSITLEEALNLFKLPRVVGKWLEKDVVAAIGRFGPYLRYDGKFTSIKRVDAEDDPLTISLERSIELIKAKMQADKERIISEFDGEPFVSVLNGRYGPFIQVSNQKAKKINVKIPKDQDPKKLTREDCLALMEAQINKKK